MQNFGRNRSNWRKTQLKALMSKRNKILRARHPPAILGMVLPRLERQIAALQQELVDIDALRAGQRRQEQGETSAGYLKRTIQARQAKRQMGSIRHPTTDVLCSTPDTLQSACCTYYQNLYTAEPVDETAIASLLANIPASTSLPDNIRMPMTAPFTLEELQLGAKRAPQHSSPGLDGLPYSIWYLVLQHPEYQALALQVFNEAFS
ncbi:hypothetical protein BCR43DRAFT_543078, partial [Syncephalastrum racemosum]